MRRAIAVVALVVSVAGPARAVDFKILNEPLRLDITESLYLKYHADPGNGDASSANYGEMLSRLNVQLAWRRFLVGFRIDSAAYVNAPNFDDPNLTATKPNCDPVTMGGCTVHINKNDQFTNGQFRRYRQTPYDPRKFFEKMFLSYSGRSIDATLGDFYVNFGRGLVLSIRKLDELGIDTTLLGGKFAVHQGDFSAIAAAGWTNIQNVDEATATYMPDPYDFVSGVHADYRIKNKVLVGVNEMFGLPNSCPQKDANAFSPDPNNPDDTQRAMSNNACPKPPDEADYYLRFGGSLDAPHLTDWLALYAEYVRAQDRLSGAPANGNALYGAATVFAGRATWLGEFKWYDDYRAWHASNDPFTSLVYMQPPTLERVQTQLTDNQNIIAGRARVDLRVNNQLVLFASAELGRLHPTDVTTDTLYDFYVGSQVRWNEGRSYFFPLVGYRQEHDDIAHSIEEQLIAIEWDAAQALPHRFSIECQGLVWIRQKGDEIVPGSGDNAWREGNVYVSLKWAPKLSVAAGYEFTTMAKEQENQHNFFNGSIQWNITPSTSLNLFGGGQRPGLKCISGVCRTFPAFNGAKLELVVRL